MNEKNKKIKFKGIHILYTLVLILLMSLTLFLGVGNQSKVYAQTVEKPLLNVTGIKNDFKVLQYTYNILCSEQTNFSGDTSGVHNIDCCEGDFSLSSNFRYCNNLNKSYAFSGYENSDFTKLTVVNNSHRAVCLQIYYWSVSTGFQDYTSVSQFGQLQSVLLLFDSYEQLYNGREIVLDSSIFGSYGVLIKQIDFSKVYAPGIASGVYYVPSFTRPVGTSSVGQQYISSVRKASGYLVADNCYLGAQPSDYGESAATYYAMVDALELKPKELPRLTHYTFNSGNGVTAVEFETEFKNSFSLTYDTMFDWFYNQIRPYEDKSIIDWTNIALYEDYGYTVQVEVEDSADISVIVPTSSQSTETSSSQSTETSSSQSTETSSSQNTEISSSQNTETSSSQSTETSSSQNIETSSSQNTETSSSQSTETSSSQSTETSSSQSTETSSSQITETSSSQNTETSSSQSTETSSSQTGVNSNSTDFFSSNEEPKQSNEEPKQSNEEPKQSNEEPNQSEEEPQHNHNFKCSFSPFKLFECDCGLNFFEFIWQQIVQFFKNIKSYAIILFALVIGVFVLVGIKKSK